MKAWIIFYIVNTHLIVNADASFLLNHVEGFFHKSLSELLNTTSSLQATKFYKL